jgi:hypothetical protein
MTGSLPSARTGRARAGEVGAGPILSLSVTGTGYWRAGLALDYEALEKPVANAPSASLLTLRYR